MQNEYLGITDNIEYLPLHLLRRTDIRMPIEATFLYGLFFDRLTAGYHDEEGRRYVVYESSTMQEDMHTSAKELAPYLIMLEAADLIERMELPGGFYIKGCTA